MSRGARAGHDWGEALSEGQCACLAPLNSVTALALWMAGAWVLAVQEPLDASDTGRAVDLQRAFGLALLFGGLASCADHCFATALTHAADHLSLWAILACATALLLSASGVLRAGQAASALLALLAIVCAGQLFLSRVMDRLIYVAIPLGVFCLGLLLWHSSRGVPQGKRFALLAAGGAVLTALLQNPATLGIRTPVRHWYLNTHAWFHVTAAVTLLLFFQSCRALEDGGPAPAEAPAPCS